MNKLKLSPKTFYEYHTNEINKYKNLDTKTLHVVYQNIQYGVWVIMRKFLT